MFKKHLFHGLTAGVLAAIASSVWNYVYSEELMLVDFSSVVGVKEIIGACIFSSVLASVGYFVSLKFLKGNADIIFNLLFAVITIASLGMPVLHILPETIEYDIQTLFPSLVLPMHFFPVVGWHTVKPLFFKNK